MGESHGDTSQETSPLFQEKEGMEGCDLFSMEKASPSLGESPEGEYRLQCPFDGAKDHDRPEEKKKRIDQPDPLRGRENLF